MIETASAEGIDAAIHAMMRRPDSTPMLREISVPTLVIAGEEDAIIPVSDAEALDREISRSRLVVLPGAGHLSSLEQPDAFNAVLGRFLQERLA